MSESNGSSPLAGLKKAEQTLLGSVARATQLTDEVATGELDAALDRFQASTIGAVDRLRAAQLRLAQIAGGLLADLIGGSEIIEAEIVANRPMLTGPAEQQLEEAPVKRRKRS